MQPPVSIQRKICATYGRSNFSFGLNSWAIEDLETLMEMIAEEKLKPVIDTVLPLEQTAEGVRQLRDREVIGKIVITRNGTAPMNPPESG